MMRRFLIHFLLSFILFVSCSKDDEVFVPVDRTIIIYMAADNDLSEDAWDNIREIQDGYRESGANLLVFIDSAEDAPHILKIGRGSSTRVKTYPEFNSADAAQMERVLNDIVEMYPAASYGLVLWSHGTSWLPAGSHLKSFGEDNGRQMNITALASSLPIRFDFILMDACLMGSVEVAYELRNKTDFIIASPTEIIYTGFPYVQIISELLRAKPDFDKVAEEYINFYNQLSGAYRSATISLLAAMRRERRRESITSKRGYFSKNGCKPKQCEIKKKIPSSKTKSRAVNVTEFRIIGMKARGRVLNCR